MASIRRLTVAQRSKNVVLSSLSAKVPQVHPLTRSVGSTRCPNTPRYVGYRRPQPSLRCGAVAGDEPVYNGTYGQWRLEKEDYIEVYSYRISLSVTAASLLLGVVVALLSEDNTLHSTLLQFLNPACILGGASFGAALFLIHIYVDPIKRTLQALWALGFACGLFLMATQAEPLPVYVTAHPEAVWLVGPFFAALTGLAIKEGFCYGKPEAAGLAVTLPLLLLGHLSGLPPLAVEKVLMVAAMGCFTTLAARKYTQAVKDDIGDKSVFTFRNLPAEEQQAVLAGLRAERGDLS